MDIEEASGKEDVYKCDYCELTFGNVSLFNFHVMGYSDEVVEEAGITTSQNNEQGKCVLLLSPTIQF